MNQASLFSQNASFYLIDGHAIAYRSYFGLTANQGSEQWRTTDGEPTAGIFGFSRILLRLIEKDRPTHLAVAFDTGKTFRNDLYAEYKATRAKMPDDLRPQIERMRELVDTLGIPRLEMEGFEADDVLGSAARLATEHGYKVRILTGDKDLLQLVNENTCVCLSGGKVADSKDYTPEMVKDFLGVSPAMIVDYKALVGDPSDNYPGVAGVGPKTAVILLREYGSLENIYANLDKIKGALRVKLETNHENALLSQKLAKIRTDLDVKINLDTANTTKFNFSAAEPLFKTLQFSTLLPELRKLASISAVVEAQPSLFEFSPAEDPQAYRPETVIVDNEEALSSLIDKLSAYTRFSFDTETTGVDPMSCALVGISLALGPGTGYYIPVGHITNDKQLPLNSVREKLNSFFSNPEIQKMGHNIKYDALVLNNHGFFVKGIADDSMIAGWILEPNSRRLGLKQMAANLLGIEMTHIEELIGKGKNQRTMADVRIALAAPYAAADAEVVIQLMPILRQRMKEQDTEKIYQDLEIPLIPVLIEMEKNGICLDKDYLRQMSKPLAARALEIEKEIYQLVGYPFNLNSPQQLSKVLFETLKLTPPDAKKKTASGFYSTGAEVLEEMRGMHPVVDLALENRELMKLINTYVDALPETVNPRTGRIHTSFSQTGTVTGRLASSAPNLQNIPTRTELGRQVRAAFTAAPGNILLSVDYSQIELRIVAHMSQDENMIAAFKAGQDIHAATAAAIYSCPIEKVSKEMRRHAKAINFGLIYGMGSFSLSKSTNLTLREASSFTKAYFAQFPRVKDFLDEIKVKAAQEGFVETLMGRKRYFPNLKSELNYNIRSREEREAINAPVQGTAADIMKLAMARLDSALTNGNFSARILLQVHDEVILELPQDELEKTRAIVQRIMEDVCQLSVPLITDARSGVNWGVLTPIE